MPDDSFARALPARLRQLRQARHLSQEQLAELAGVSVRTVSNLERGSAHLPRPATARQLAHALGLRGEHAAAFVDHACAPASIAAPVASPLGDQAALIGPNWSEPAAACRRHYDALPDGVQRVFRQLAVFAASFGQPAAAAVGDFDDGGRNGGPGGAATGDVLAALVAAGLLGTTDHAGDHFALPAPASALALTLLTTTGEAAAARRRHAVWLVECLEESGPEPVAAGTGAWYRRRAELAPEWESALSWALTSGETSLAARLARCLYRYWAAVGRLAPGAAWLDAILAATENVDPAVLADVRLGAGALAFTQSHYRVAARHWRSAATGAGEGEGAGLDSLRPGHLQANRGLLAWYGTQDARRALHRFDLARRHFGRAGAAMPLAYMHRNAAVVATACGDFAAADAALRASFRESALAGDASSHAMSLGDLAELSLRQGDHASASAHLRAALALNDNEAAVLWTLHVLTLAGQAARVAGDAWRGTLLEAAVARGRQECGLPWRPLAGRDSAGSELAAPLPASTYGEAWWAGSRLGLAEARNLVLAG